MAYKIEKGIELPIIKSVPNSYPFKDMNKGDSFIVGRYTRENMTKYSNAGRSWAKKRGIDWKFVMRKVEGNKIRMWRVK